tara:strand:- start:53 stop:745 length:693 start_codon:yes stop_codon:yes gene_type:complete
MLYGKGLWCLACNPITTRLIASDPKVDFLIFDEEHSQQTFSDLISFQGIVSNFNKKFGIRLASHSQENILKAYEIFPHYIMIPGITNISEAKKALERFNSPPIGKRGFSPYTYGSIRSSLEINKFPKIFLQVENKASLDIIDEILNLENLNGIFIGRYDLSISLDIDIKSKKMTDVISHIASKCKAAKINVGTVAIERNEIKEMENLIDFWTIGSDVSLIIDGLNKNSLI